MTFSSFCLTRLLLQSQGIDSRQPALLRMKLPRPLELVVCAAVSVTGADGEDQGDRIVCEYKLRFILEEVPQFKIRENPEGRGLCKPWLQRPT